MEKPKRSPTYERDKRYREKNHERYLANKRRTRIKRKYGISVEEYDAYLATPCSICGSSSEVLDHNHKTNEVRDSLCHSCNRALGLFKDNPERILSAYNYLNKYGHYGEEEDV